jgi:antirestriction protein ArdC
MANQLYQNVTDRILRELETGTAPWVKPWSATPGKNIPHNAATGNAYSGCNVILLWMAQGAYSSPRWLTFKQAKDLGGSVRKGEKSPCTIVKVLRLEDKRATETDENGKRVFTTLKAYAVFNVDQCDGLPVEVLNPEPIKPHHDDERDATIDEFIAASGCDFRPDVGGDRAYYSPSQDFIAMPAFEAFNSAALYYGVAFHELGHWTGHKSRLDRDEGMKGRFGTQAYAAEELVAELCAAFLCAEFNVNGQLQHAEYIANWIALLKSDSRAFFTAASKAQGAAQFLRDKALAEPMALAA